jgi:DNA-binding NarL/FixJ family response regulator
MDQHVEEQLPPIPHLTNGEYQILELLAAGLSNGGIARRLYVSEKDVEYHIHHLISKFGARNRTGVVGRAYALRLLAIGRWPPVSVRLGSPR